MDIEKTCNEYVQLEFIYTEFNVEQNYLADENQLSKFIKKLSFTLNDK